MNATDLIIPLAGGVTMLLMGVVGFATWLLTRGARHEDAAIIDEIMRKLELHEENETK
jgi:hypothetical protein